LVGTVLTKFDAKSAGYGYGYGYGYGDHAYHYGGTAVEANRHTPQLADPVKSS